MTSAEIVETFYPLNNLSSFNGELIGGAIAERIVIDPSINTVVLFGEPGAGKSTIQSQLVESINRLAAAEIPMYFVRYEDAMAQTEDQTRLPRRWWSNREYLRMSTNLTYAIDSQNSSRLSEPRSLLFVETVSLVAEDGLDRAVTTLAILARQQGLLEKPNTLFLGIIADPRAQKRAGLIRGEINDIEDGDVIDYLRERYHLVISGIDGSADGGSKVKRIIQRQAIIERMYEISRQVLLRAFSWLSTSENEQLASNIWLPQETNLLDPAAVSLNQDMIDPTRALLDYYRFKTAYMEYYMRREFLRLPESYAMIIHNPFNPEKTIHWDVTSLITP